MASVSSASKAKPANNNNNNKSIKRIPKPDKPAFDVAVKELDKELKSKIEVAVSICKIRHWILLHPLFFNFCF